MMAAEPRWIAADWGTSNLRAWGIGDDGAVLFSRSSDQGMGRLTRERYPDALTHLLGDVIAPEGEPLDVLICGMAGARQGWLEAPYIETPAALDEIWRLAVIPAMPGSRLRPRILPGVCQRGGNDDVMRGEETQLLGLLASQPGFDGVVCMPGTHAKWVSLSERRIARFATAMTGELFDVLRTHSVLRHSLGGEIDPTERREGMLEGLATGTSAPERLTAVLFRARASALLAGRSPSWCDGFLSGLLIGAEIGGRREWIGSAEIPLIGGSGLAEVYLTGLEMIGAKGRVVDASEVTLAGLMAAYREGEKTWRNTVN